MQAHRGCCPCVSRERPAPDPRLQLGWLPSSSAGVPGPSAPYSATWRCLRVREQELVFAHTLKAGMCHDSPRRAPGHVAWT